MSPQQKRPRTDQMGLMYPTVMPGMAPPMVMPGMAPVIPGMVPPGTYIVASGLVPKYLPESPITHHVGVTGNYWDEPERALR